MADRHSSQSDDIASDRELPPVVFEAVARYLSDEMSVAERAAFVRRLTQDAVLQGQIEAFRAMWSAAERVEEPPLAIDGHTALRQVSARIGLMPADSVTRRLPRVSGAHAVRRASVMARWARAAAAVLVMAGGAIVWRSPGLQSLLVRHDATAIAPSTQGAVRTWETPAGRRANIVLTDGSRIVLSPGSRLRVGADFGVQTRDVQLEGEAYFTVTHDRAHPFAVHTAHAVARDLGTAFNVRAYPELPAVEVAVTDGVVALASARIHDANPPRDSVVLRASDIGVVHANGHLVTERGADVTARTAWTTGRLIFDGRPLSDVLPTLARWYDLDIRLATPALGARLLTTTLHDASADAALERVGLALDLHVKRVGRVVTLSGDR